MITHGSQRINRLKSYLDGQLCHLSANHSFINCVSLDNKRYMRVACEG